MAATAAPASQAPASEAPARAPLRPRPSEAPSREPLCGELTRLALLRLGRRRDQRLPQGPRQRTRANKDLKVNVVEQPFSDIFNKWQTDVLAGGGPDMYIAPNDNLFTQADAGALADVSTRSSRASSRASTRSRSTARKVDGKFYMVPESLKAVALWYDKSQDRHAAGHDG